MQYEETLLIQQSKPGCTAFDFKLTEIPEIKPDFPIPEHLLRKIPPKLPEVSEPVLFRHFIRLSQQNYALDTNIYPLGSCTMKYNPRLNEYLANIEHFKNLHPLLDTDYCTSALKIMTGLQKFLCEISGLHACTLQPAAGAHGELTALLILRKYLQKNAPHKDTIIIPDSAHGTNPASAAMAGFKIKKCDSDENGLLTPEAVKKQIDENTAGIMITNPNTLGIFEPEIRKIADLIHENGAYLYLDGANMNAIQGIVKPADMGVDLMHFNLHKTFATPHGGGGPGAGPVCVTERFTPYLPNPQIRLVDGQPQRFDSPDSIGKMRAFNANFLVALRAYATILALGKQNIPKAAQLAVLNANYIFHRLKDIYQPAHTLKHCLHEAVFSDRTFKIKAKTAEIAKRLIDFQIHPPTCYFPINVPGAMMIEPTETEPIESLDNFIETMRTIFDEINSDPTILQNAPTNAFRKKIDELTPARNPVLKHS